LVGSGLAPVALLLLSQPDIATKNRPIAATIVLAPALWNGFFFTASLLG
jgi:hypothetical protein